MKVIDDPNQAGLLEQIRLNPLGEELQLLAKPCGDCAVTCGLYIEFSEAYKQMPLNEQLERSKRWFCHNAPNRACRGHANNIGITWENE